MFVPFIALLLVMSVPLAGGHLSALGRVRLRSVSLVLVALVLQILITTFIQSGPRPVLVGLHLLSYVLAGVMLWRNRRLPGLLVIGLGSISNGGVIALNHGTLPASASALARAGKTVNPADFTNSGVLPHPVLAPLGDVLATPAWLPFRNIVSIGDVLILVGTALLLHGLCHSWLTPSRWRPFHDAAAKADHVLTDEAEPDKQESAALGEVSSHARHELDGSDPQWELPMQRRRSAEEVSAKEASSGE